jgi:hypothetical protein
MDCSKFQSHFTTLLDGKIVPALRERLLTHLKKCLNCYRTYCGLQKTREVLSQLPELDPPEHLSALVLARVKDRGFRQWGWLAADLPRWLPRGVGVTALLFIIIILFQTIPSSVYWESKPPDSQKSLITSGRPSEQPAARLTTTNRNYATDAPVMVLKVKDFSRVDQELESMLRWFSRPMLPEREPARSVRSSSARLIDVRVSGQQFPHLIRELHKIGHLDHSQFESRKVVTPSPHKTISIRIVVVSNGADTETRGRAETGNQAADRKQQAVSARPVGSRH